MLPCFGQLPFDRFPPCRECRPACASTLVPSCVTTFRSTSPSRRSTVTRFVNSSSNRSWSCTRKSESVCALISWHPVSQRRPGSQPIIRAKARAEAISILYPYSQILASSRGGKQGRPAAPSRDSIPSSQRLKSSFPSSSQMARTRWSAGTRRSTSTGAKKDGARSMGTYFGGAWAWSRPSVEAVIQDSLRHSETKVQRNVPGAFGGFFLKPVSDRCF